MAPHRVLVVGQGGREHALAWRLARDPFPAEVLVTPGNDGIGREFRRLTVGENDAPSLIDACRRERIDLVVIGPEGPLAAGVVDALEAAGIPAFGPSQAAARLESSKWFAKELMMDAGVPTARAEAFDDVGAARSALARRDPPYVVKADGLAAGKGVKVTHVREDAEDFVVECLERGRFGLGGRRVIVEEYLEGEERTAIAVCDGKDFVLLPAARDYKRADDGDRGPNTGGMGAFAPAEAADSPFEAEVARTIVAPILKAMSARGCPFKGALYCGLMVRGDGVRVVEFNARFGDPEAQVLMPLLEGSLSTLLASAARGGLEARSVTPRSGTAVAVTLADSGYPGQPSRGGTLEGLDALAQWSDVMVFHAGTRAEGEAWRIGGGRALYVVAHALTREAARARVYAGIARLGGEGWRCRRDIAAPSESAVFRRPAPQGA